MNARGRAAYKAATGGTLRPPVKSGDDPRRASFLARMGAVRGPMVKDGKPTRLALALRAWGASSKEDARKKARAISKRLRARYGENPMNEAPRSKRSSKQPELDLFMSTRRNPARKNLARGLGITQGDTEAARELYLYAANDYDLYRQNILPIILNLQRKIKSGKYKAELAPKIWRYAADNAAKTYTHGGSGFGIGKGYGIFTVPIRNKAAEMLMEHFNEEVMEARENPRARKNLTRPSQATGRKPGARLLRRRKRTIGAPRGFFANPAQSMYKVLARAKPSAPFALIGSFKDKARAMQYARAVHKASPTSLSVKVTT